MSKEDDKLEDRIKALEYEVSLLKRTLTRTEVVLTTTCRKCGGTGQVWDQFSTRVCPYEDCDRGHIVQTAGIEFHELNEDIPTATPASAPPSSDPFRTDLKNKQTVGDSDDDRPTADGSDVDADTDGKDRYVDAVPSAPLLQPVATQNLVADKPIGALVTPVMTTHNPNTTLFGMVASHPPPDSLVTTTHNANVTLFGAAASHPPSLTNLTLDDSAPS